MDDNSYVKSLGHDAFRSYILTAYHPLFPMDFTERLRFSMAYQYMPQCESGWYALIDECLGRIENFLFEHEFLEKGVYVRQIKEKFGSLRIYVRPDDDWPDAVAEGVAKIRMEIEERSSRVCEVCGEPGEIVQITGYYQCLCPDHEGKRRAWAERGKPDEDWR